MSAKNRYLGKMSVLEQQQQAGEAEDKVNHKNLMNFFVEKKVQGELLFKSLKRHIIKEREHKKQLEAETAKEEKTRIEREARKKQDNMNLGLLTKNLTLWSVTKLYLLHKFRKNQRRDLSG